MRTGALMLLAARTDVNAQNTGRAWLTRCLHCGSHVGVSESGTPMGTTTLEHIVPRSWFGIRAAADLVERVGAPDDPRNLALACARCNQQKGRTHDAHGPADERAHDVVARLLAKRLARFVERLP